MTEAVVVNFFLLVRVLLIVAILIALPRITRKGLLFGVYVGEATGDGDAAGQLVRDWNRCCAALTLPPLLIGLALTLAGRPVAGNLTGTAVLLLGALALFVRFHMRARDLAPPAVARQAEVSVAPLGPTGGLDEGRSLAKLALGVSIVLALATLLYALTRYDPSVGLSPLVVLLLPLTNLVFSPFFALLALLTAGAKRSLRSGTGGHSLEAQDGFRAAMTRFITWFALVLCAYLALLSLQIVRSGFANATLAFLGVGATAVIVFAASGWIRILRRFGQGGALAEQGAVDAPLTNGLADNTHWVWGLFYVDRNDPAILVEKRFGMGYAFNYGNRKAILILVTFATLGLGLAVLTVVAVLQRAG